MSEGVWTEIIDRHIFFVDVVGRIRVSQQTILAAKYGIALAQNAIIGEPGSFRIMFQDWIIDDKTGKPGNIAGKYNPKNGYISLGLESPSFKSIHLLQPEAALLVATHESVHKMQKERGDNDFPENFDGPDYINSQAELEAWDVALHVFKKAYPRAKGGFTFHGRRFDVPEKSKF